MSDKKFENRELIVINLESGEYEEYFKEYFVCPVCSFDEITRDHNFCGCCGRKIKWLT